MIRRPLTSIGLKQADVEQMEGCLLRRSKNPEQNENEASPHVQRSGSEAPPMRMATRASGERERAFASPRSTGTSEGNGGTLGGQQEGGPSSPVSTSETAAASP